MHTIAHTEHDNIHNYFYMDRPLSRVFTTRLRVFTTRMRVFTTRHFTHPSFQCPVNFGGQGGESARETCHVREGRG